VAPAGKTGFKSALLWTIADKLTSQNEGQEGDGQGLQRDELDDGEHNLDNDGLLQLQGQKKGQQHLLHALAAGLCLFYLGRKQKESGKYRNAPKSIQRLAVK